MDPPEWLGWLAAAVIVIGWRRAVYGAMRDGRLGPRAAPAVYAAVIPVLVIAYFALAGRLGGTAVVYAALGFALSYALAVFTFGRARGR